MQIELRRGLCVALLTAAITLTLTACGGGGDDDDEVEAPEDEDASGLWQGTFSRGGVSAPMGVIAAPSGLFVAMVGGASSRLIIGTGAVTLDTFNATGTVLARGGTLPNGSASAPMTIAAGRVTERASLTGNYSGGGETATISLSFDPKALRGASLATVAGTYSASPPPADPNLNATLTIQSNGAATFATGAGCNGTGNFAVIDPALNMYSWTLTIGACGAAPEVAFSGLAALNDNAATGGTNNLISLLGTTAARTASFAFFGVE